MRRLTPFLVVLAIASTVFAGPPEDPDKYIAHLEFSNYEAAEGDDAITATHSSHLNMILKGYKGGVLLQTYFETSDWDIKDKDLVEMVNRLNAAATVARFYIDGDEDTMVEAWFPGDYDRKRFSTFLEAWHGDTSGQYPLVGEYMNK